MPLSQLITDFQILILMTVRILILLSFTPLVSASQTPFLVRVVLASLVAYMVRYIMKVDVYTAPNTLGEFVVLLSGEALIGAIMGFYVQMVFMFLSSISEFFSTLMGLRAVQVLNPLSGISSAVVAQFISVLVILVFISSYGLQKIFYYGVSQSFYSINVISLLEGSDRNILGFVFFNFARLFEKSFIIALPLFIALLLVNIGLGLFGKVAPQINLLVLGLPLQLGLGIVFLFLFLPSIVHGIESVFDNMFLVISSFIKRV